MTGMPRGSAYLYRPKRSEAKVIATKIAKFAVVIGGLLIIFATLGSAYMSGLDRQEININREK